VIPFGLSCVAASAENAGHEVQVLDLCFSRHPEKEIADVLGRFSPEVVGINIRNIDNGVGYNTQFLLTEIRDRIVEPCKQCFPGPIIIGGPAAGINGPELLHYLDLEFAVRGDGEAAIVEFLRRVASDESMAGMEGLVWRKEEKIVEKNAPIRVEDLDDLPFVNPTRYLRIEPYVRFNSPIQIQTKRGCALRCSYCTYNGIEGHQYRLRDSRKVADDIELLVGDTGIRKIEFTDSTFNIPLDHAKAVLRELIKKGLDLDLRTMGLNPGAVDEELVALMKEAGFQDVDLGAEAGCDDMLRSLGKNFRKNDVIRAGQLLRKYNIPVTWYLLLGAVGETPETLRETFDTINQAASPWDLVNIAVGMRVYNGSPVSDWIRREYPSLAEGDFFYPVSLPESTALDLKEIKRLAKLESFKHPNFFMYDEDEKTPPFFLALGAALMKLTCPSQPVWRLFILLRRIQTIIGIRRIQSWRFARRNFNHHPPLKD
jgi:radical SAM superfamily enzyme YgiQ (UPF0313 family)